MYKCNTLIEAVDLAFELANDSSTRSSHKRSCYLVQRKNKVLVYLYRPKGRIMGVVGPKIPKGSRANRSNPCILKAI